jgi:multidrug efflux pump subunit AcrB
LNLTQTAIDNPHGVAVVVAVVVVFGVVSLLALPLQLTPDIERPQISIEATWRAAAPEEVESEILEPIQKELEGLQGLKEMTGVAGQGQAYINMNFALQTDLLRTRMDIIDRLNRIPPLPRDADPPLTHMGGGRGSGGDTNLTLIYYYIQLDVGNSNPIDSYQKMIEDSIIPQLESVPGVSRISMNTQRPLQLQIDVDPYRAAELGVPLPHVFNMAATPLDVSGGFVELGRRQYMLRFAGKYEPEELEQLVLMWREDKPVYLGDIAEVRVARGVQRSFTIQNGRPAVSIRIDRESGANVLDTLDRVKVVIEELRVGLLAENQLRIEPSFDPSVFINRAITLVGSNLVVGIMLTIGVLWWFLRGPMATLIIASTIPISLLATFVVLNLTGRSINVISLAGLAFSVGMVVDAAIVVLENIVRLREAGEQRAAAAVKGAVQVWPALFASTTTTVAIFLPVIFIEDVEGQLFADLALTIAIAVSISLLVAVTILPVAAERFLSHGRLEDQHQNFWHRVAVRIMALTNGRTRRFTFIGLLMLTPVVMTWLFLPKLDYLPPVKRDAVDVFINMPPAASISFAEEEVAQKLIDRLEPYMAGEKEPALRNYFIMSFSTFGGMLGVRAKDQSRVNELQQVIATEIIKDIPDAMMFPQRGNLFGNFENDRGIAFMIQAQEDDARAEAARRAVARIREVMPGARARAEPPLVQFDSELRLIPKDQQIIEAGWNRRDVARMTRAFGNGLYVGEYFDGDDRMDIIVKAGGWETPEDMENLVVASPAGQIFQLGQLVEMQRTVGPGSINHFGGKRTQTIYVEPPERVSLQETLEILQEQVEPVVRRELPSDGTIVYSGTASSLADSIVTMSSNFLLALFLLYALMAGLFKSLKDSLIVLLTIPLATVGGVMALQILNLIYFQPLDLLTMIGFIILLGLVVNNAILLVHQTRSGERSGLDREEAVSQALHLRVRPIFMSTLTSIFGMLPLLLIPGEGALIYRGLAGVIVGGMAVSTLFTLVLLPCLLRMGHGKPLLGEESAEELAEA